MAAKEVVSGVGANSARTDKNVSERVAKIQREAKVQNSSGGAYGQRAEMTSIAQGAPTTVPSATMPSPSMVSQIPTVNAFAPGSGREGIPLADGAPSVLDVVQKRNHFLLMLQILILSSFVLWLQQILNLVN